MFRIFKSNGTFCSSLLLIQKVHQYTSQTYMATEWCPWFSCSRIVPKNAIVLYSAYDDWGVLFV